MSNQYFVHFHQQGEHLHTWEVSGKATISDMVEAVFSTGLCADDKPVQILIYCDTDERVVGRGTIPPKLFDAA